MKECTTLIMPNFDGPWTSKTTRMSPGLHLACLCTEHTCLSPGSF